MINLSRKDRVRFAVYAMQEAASADEMADQMVKLKVAAVAVQKYRAEAAAYRIVVDHLVGGEELEVTSEDTATIQGVVDTDSGSS